jgi:protein phosphatase
MSENLMRQVLRRAAGLMGRSSGPGWSNSSRAAATVQRRRQTSPSSRVCGITDVGRVRDLNEDNYRISADARVLLVADGMGGHAAGEVASELASATLFEFLQEAVAGRSDLPDSEARALLLEGIQRAHERVRAAAETTPGCAGMGTVVIVGLVQGNRLHVCHVGDSRCYLRSGGELVLITEDHSTILRLVRTGTLTAEEARSHPGRNEILQALGLPMNLEPSLNSRDLAQNDRALLCSDGLWEAITEDEILRILVAEDSARACARALVDAANQAGGPDNITVVVYDHPSVTPAADSDRTQAALPERPAETAP